MSEETSQDLNESAATGADDTTQQDLNTIDELAMLKQRAQLMGVPFSNNIGIETLRERIAAKMAGQSAPVEQTAATSATPAVNPLDEAVNTAVQTVADAPAAPVKPKTLRQHVLAKSMKLVRLRIVNLDPKKKSLPGEFLTVANEYLGTVTKYVPFGEVTDGGYHVPYCIYKMMKDRKFLNIQTRKVGNQIKVEQRWANEFALEILPPLTPAELAKLATAQAAAGSLN